MERFPEYKDKIPSLLRENEPFNVMCDDYRICALALKYWTQSNTKEAHNRIKEYKELLENLEEEILDHLNSVI